jgi:chromosome segregation ATPase
MQIDNTLLKEENYTNPRYVEVTDEKIIELHQSIKDLQEEINPHLDRFNEIEEKKAELKKPFNEYAKEVEPELKEIMETLEQREQRASKIKEQLIPLVRDIVSPILGEFEDFAGLELHEGKLCVKINDEVEESIKRIREAKKARAVEEQLAKK